MHFKASGGRLSVLELIKVLFVEQPLLHWDCYEYIYSLLVAAFWEYNILIVCHHHNREDLVIFPRQIGSLGG